MDQSAKNSTDRSLIILYQNWSKIRKFVLCGQEIKILSLIKKWIYVIVSIQIQHENTVKFQKSMIHVSVREENGDKTCKSNIYTHHRYL